MKAIRRISSAKSTDCCPAADSCPDMFELDNGDFALIGEDITADAKQVLLPDAGVGATERLIRVPRALIVNAKKHIPDE